MTTFRTTTGPATAAAVMVHGGAGNSPDNADGCAAAAKCAAAVLRDGGGALDAAVAAVEWMEDDGRFNAGRGADLKLDGNGFEMCASVMDSAGALGAVTCVRDVRHPIALARAVATTPHWCLAGEGADRLARHLGMAPADHDLARAQRQHRARLAKLQGDDPLLPGGDNRAFERFWNFPTPWRDAVREAGSGTVGAVVRDAAGGFAVATSTGGSAPSLLGRVGDSPIVGCGFYCGALGAIGATGIGEAIVRQLLARTVYGWLEQGRGLQDALDAGIELFADDTAVGLIGVTPAASASASNRPMPTAALAC